MWPFGGRPRRDLPPVDYNESESEAEEEDFEAGLAFSSPLQSPQRPLPTREGSPQQLQYPTLNDNVDEDLELVQWKLHDIASVQEDLEELTNVLEDANLKLETREPSEVGTEVEVHGLITETTQVENCQEPSDEEENLEAPARMVNYDEATGEDTDGALQRAVTNLQNKQFNECDLDFYFSQIELKMRTCGVQKNFTKLLVLSSILPERIQDEVKNILIMQETDFGDEMPYFKLKTEILKIFKPSQEADFERAMGRVLSGRPSQLARALINDLCKNRLRGCCCNRFVNGLWKRALPNGVKQVISHLEFNADNLDQILTQADKAYASNRPQAIPSAAALSTQQMPSGAHSLPGPAVLDQGFHQDFQDLQVSAISAGRGNRGRGRGRGRGNRGGQGRGRGSSGQGGQEHPRHKGPRHADMPPISSCRRHWIFGKGAHFCEEPASCPWKNIFVAKANQ